MTERDIPSTWPLEEWKRLSEHPSPFVRLWVARSARKHTDRESLSGLLRTLLEDERALVRYHAEMDLLDAPLAELGEWYLHIALRSTFRWGRVRSALESLAAIGDGDRLLIWLEQSYAELREAGPERELILQHICTLSGYLALMPLSRAEPVAERLHGILRELSREQGELLGEPSEEDVSHALAGLLLSHPRPREVLGFQDELDCPLDLPQAISEIMGDRDWVNRLYGMGPDSDDADDTYDLDIWGDRDDDEEDDLHAPEDFEDEDDPYDMDDFDVTEVPDPAEDDPEQWEGTWDEGDPRERGLGDLDVEFLQKHLSMDFIGALEDYPRQWPRICLEHAEQVLREASAVASGAESSPSTPSDDFSRLERILLLLRVLADPELPQGSQPDDPQECALLLLLFLSAGRDCLGRSEKDFSSEEMLSLISRDRPDMLLDRGLLSRLKSGAGEASSSFREMLLEHCRAALSDYGQAWSKRVLDLAPVYGLEELIPGIMELLREQDDVFQEEAISQLEDILAAFRSPRIWEEYVRHSGGGDNPVSSKLNTWPALFYLQNAPCPEALEWLRANLPVLLEKDEIEALEAVRLSGDARFISELQPFLAEDEDRRKEVFQTLCRLHGDSRALGPEEEVSLWERREAEHEEMLKMARSVLQEESPPSSPHGERIQLRCDQCGGMFHYRPERIVIYYPPEGEAREFAVDIGGEIACKACGAPVDRLGLTSFGQFQLMSSTLPNLSYATVQNDVQILGENKECEKQVLVCPQGQEVLGEPVETMSQGLERYDRLLANDPENTGFLVGKANLLFRLLRLRETEAYYHRVLEGDPSCLDALVGLFDLCRRQGREQEAWEWLQQAHDLLHRGNVVRGDRNDLQERIRQVYAREASRRGMAPEQPVRSRKHRVQRNDPCPCGSGKKFKKCCLDK